MTFAPKINAQGAPEKLIRFIWKEWAGQLESIGRPQYKYAVSKMKLCGGHLENVWLAK